MNTTCSRIVGKPVQFFLSNARPPFPAQILHLGRPREADDGIHVSVVAYNPDSQKVERFDNVPHGEPVYPGQPFYRDIDD